MSRIISSIYKSLLRSVNDTIEVINDELSVGAVYWSWQSRDDEDKMPQATLVGLDGFNFDENKGLWIIRAAVTLSSYQDYNLHEESEILDILHERYGYHKKISMRDPETGEVISELFVVEFQVMPMGQSELRNYRTVAFELMRTSTVEA